MKTIFQLIELYTLACELYDKGRTACFQRISNNAQPGGITDPELIAIYWFCHLHQRFEKKAMHAFIRDYWWEFFPKLPAYQTFVARLNQLEPTFQALGALLQARLQAQTVAELDQLLDSMPIALARGGHAYTATRRARHGRCRLLRQQEALLSRRQTARGRHAAQRPIANPAGTVVTRGLVQ